MSAEVRRLVTVSPVGETAPHVSIVRHNASGGRIGSVAEADHGRRPCVCCGLSSPIFEPWTQGAMLGHHATLDGAVAALVEFRLDGDGRVRR